MAILHDDELYGQHTARLLDLAISLLVVVIREGGMIVLPPKDELQRITAGPVLRVNPDEYTGNILLTVVPPDQP